jgi:hypothetical protein
MAAYNMQEMAVHFRLQMNRQKRPVQKSRRVPSDALRIEAEQKSLAHLGKVTSSFGKAKLHSARVTFAVIPSPTAALVST